MDNFLLCLLLRLSPRFLEFLEARFYSVSVTSSVFDSDSDFFTDIISLLLLNLPCLSTNGAGESYSTVSPNISSMLMSNVSTLLFTVFVLVSILLLVLILNPYIYNIQNVFSHTMQ